MAKYTRKGEEAKVPASLLSGTRGSSRQGIRPGTGDGRPVRSMELAATKDVIAQTFVAMMNV